MTKPSSAASLAASRWCRDFCSRKRSKPRPRTTPISTPNSTAFVGSVHSIIGGMRPRKVKFRFAPDSPLEGAGFEPSVPRSRKGDPVFAKRTGEGSRRRQEAIPRPVSI